MFPGWVGALTKNGTLRESDILFSIEQAGVLRSSRLKDNRFASIVISDFCRKGASICRGFVKDTVIACQDAGLKLYNDAVLLTVAGSLPVRARAASKPPVSSASATGMS